MALLNKLSHFLKTGIWAFRLGERPWHHSLWIKPLRVVVLAVQGFIETRCMLRASALTFFTLLSIVPLLAVTFGVAKGFNVDKALEQQIRSEFSGQREVIDRAIEFAQAMLARTSGGLVAGLGIAFLLWTVIKVLSNIEEALNEVWGVRKPRSIVRKLTDYLAFMVILPLLFIMAGSATVLVTGGVKRALSWVGEGEFEFLETPIELMLKLLSLLLIWMLFWFIYVFLPNTRVRMVPALVGALIAGSAFHLAQWAYLRFQIGVAQSNAVYGTFAALPLFLTWLQTSWLIVLFGSEVSFAWQNTERYEFEHKLEAANPRRRMAIALGVLRTCARRYTDGEAAPGAEAIARGLRTSERMINQAVQDLIDAGLLLEVKAEPGQGPAWIPARAPDTLTLREAVIALTKSEQDSPRPLYDADLVRIEHKLDEWAQAKTGCEAADQPVRDL